MVKPTKQELRDKAYDTYHLVHVDACAAYNALEKPAYKVLQETLAQIEASAVATVAPLAAPAVTRE
jgi:hypothetical protein